jgi:hypothetical protein
MIEEGGKEMKLHRTGLGVAFKRSVWFACYAAEKRNAVT